MSLLDFLPNRVRPLATVNRSRPFGDSQSESAFGDSELETAFGDSFPGENDSGADDNLVIVS